MLERCFAQIQVKASTSTDVLNMLPSGKMMHTAGSVSVTDKKGWSKEVGIVVFSEKDSLVQRTDYIQKRGGFPFIKLNMLIRTVVPDELLDEPYENDIRKHVAILRYCHSTLIKDAKPFVEDQQTESLTGLARTALSIGITQLTASPREADLLLQPDGFEHEHSTLDKCKLNLKQEDNNIFIITIRTKALADPFVSW